VQTNRKALVTDLEKLTRVMKTINSERASIDDALTVAPVAMNNLVLAYDTKSGSIGSRIGIQQNIWDLDGLLCAFVQQSGLPAVSKELACTLFEQIVESGTPSKAAVRRAVAEAKAAATSPEAARDPRSTTVQETYAGDGAATVEGLFGGAS
jgi:phospholipid/cholesterol/gamma-HCH transport system substrate-binding protein